MKPVIFTSPGNEAIAGLLAAVLKVKLGSATVRCFPDGESYVRMEWPVPVHVVAIICTIDWSAQKFLGLAFLVPLR